MIPKSGNRFSEKIMLKLEIDEGSDPTQLDQTRGARQSLRSFMLTTSRSAIYAAVGETLREAS